MSFAHTVNREIYHQLPRRSLIVCASLVHNPANLGGLCRTAEVLRLELLTVAHSKIMTEQAFIDLAVSAHYWQPLAVWQPSQLLTHLETYQAHHYTVIALQQHQRATCLTEFQFPQRSLLVLGRELTGVPASVIDQANHCVVIPQAGIVDSLNVQVAGAIAMYEYARQHPL